MRIVSQKYFDDIRSLSSKALTYSLLTVFFQLFLTPIVILMVTLKLSPEQQGYYYTFLSFVALQTFFELGLFAFILNKASSFFSNLLGFEVRHLAKSDAIRTNLAALYNLTRNLYMLISFLFFIFVGIFGLIFFSGSGFSVISEIQLSWIILCTLCSIQLFYLGLNSFLEGCGQIDKVEKYKLIAFVSSNVTLIVLLFFEIGLLSLAFSFLPKILKDVYLVHFVFGREFNLLASSERAENLKFKTDVAPMQFRLAISGIFSFLQYSAFVPLVFVILGPVQAGIIGVGLQITSFVQQILTRWTHTQQPKMANLASLKQFSELDALVNTIQRVQLKVSTIVILGFTIVYNLLNYFELKILDRVPSFWVIFVLLIAACAYGLLSIRIGYLRAFVEERAHVLSVTIAVINLLVCYMLLQFTGLFAVSTSYVISTLFVALPWSQVLVWKKRGELDYTRGSPFN